MSTTLGSAARLFEHAALYAAARPPYPPALYDLIFRFAGLPLGHRRLALDAATGTGQVAAELSKTFDQVIACDASEAQLAAAPVLSNVTYLHRCAEALGNAVPAGAVDLATAAQALHWFDAEKFFEEMRRVLRPQGQGTLAAWCYNPRPTFLIGGVLASQAAATAANAAFTLLHDTTLREHWDDRRLAVDDRYRGLAAQAGRFFTTVVRKELEERRRWSLGQIATYLRSLSSYQAYVKERGAEEDPVETFCSEVAAAAAAGEAGTKSNAEGLELDLCIPHFVVLAK